MIKKIFVVLTCSLLLGAGRASASDPVAISHDLYNRSATVRMQAAERLAAIGPSAIPALRSVVCGREKPKFELARPFAAKVLGKLKTGEGATCLVGLLMYEYPPIGPVEMKTDQTLADVDPAFAALVQIGDPAVPAIRRHLPLLAPESAIMALRALRAINTPASKEAADAYVKFLEQQLRISKEILEEFSKG